MDSLIDIPNNAVIVRSKCAYCDNDIIFLFYRRDVLRTQQFIKVFCCECCFETLIEIENDWRTDGLGRY